MNTEIYLPALIGLKYTRADRELPPLGTPVLVCRNARVWLLEYFIDAESRLDDRALCLICITQGECPTSWAYMPLMNKISEVPAPFGEVVFLKTIDEEGKRRPHYTTAYLSKEGPHDYVMGEEEPPHLYRVDSWLPLSAVKPAGCCR